MIEASGLRMLAVEDFDTAAKTVSCAAAAGSLSHDHNNIMYIIIIIIIMHVDFYVLPALSYRLLI